MTALRTALDAASPEYVANTEAMRAKLAEVETEHAKALIGGGEKYVARHHERGKLLAREGIELLLDPDSPFLELCPLAGWGSEFTVGAALVTGIGVVSGVECLIVANDPTVRGGATNPWTLRKSFRAHEVAEQNRLPVIAWAPRRAEAVRLLASPETERTSAVAGALAVAAANRAEATVPGGLPSGWRNVLSQPQRCVLTAGTSGYEVRYRFGRDGLLAEGHDGVALVSATPTEVVLDIKGLRRTFRVGRHTRTVVVEAGRPILWLEAMKMEHQVSAPVAGVLSSLPVSVGSQVDVGTVLAVVEEGGAV